MGTNHRFRRDGITGFAARLRLALQPNSGCDETVIALLRAAGFIHVTDLPVRMIGGERGRSIACENEAWSGRWDMNNGKVVLWSGDGKAWLAIANDLTVDMARGFCLNGHGAFVPLSNGERVVGYHLLCRAADPEWNPSPALATSPSPA